MIMIRNFFSKCNHDVDGLKLRIEMVEETAINKKVLDHVDSDCVCKPGGRQSGLLPIRT